MLNTIVTRANDLIGADGCTIFEYDEAAEQFHLRATRNLEPRLVELARGTPLRRVTRAFWAGFRPSVSRSRWPTSPPAPIRARSADALIAAGYRAVVAVPLVREDHLLAL